MFVDYSKQCSEKKITITWPKKRECARTATKTKYLKFPFYFIESDEKIYGINAQIGSLLALNVDPKKTKIV